MANSYVFYANKNGRPTGLPGFVGPKGPQGEQGEQGIQGPQGEPGIFIGAEEDMPAGTRARFDPNGSPDIAAVINDANISEDETWSSSKINRDLSELSGGTGIHHVIKNLGTIWSGLESIDYNHGIVGIHNVLSAHVLLVHPTTHTAYTLPYFSAANVVVSSVLKVDHNTLSLKANSTAGWAAYNVILDIWFD